MIYMRIGAALAVLGLLLWVRHAIYQDGYDDGSKHVQTQFDAYRGKIIRLTAERKAENAATLAATEARNEAIAHGYQQALNAIAADRDSLARRLRNSQARSCSPILPTPENITGAADASTIPPSEAEFDRLYDEYDRQCRADAAQLDALIMELSPQLQQPSP